MKLAHLQEARYAGERPSTSSIELAIGWNDFDLRILWTDTLSTEPDSYPESVRHRQKISMEQALKRFSDYFYRNQDNPSASLVVEHNKAIEQFKQHVKANGPGTFSYMEDSPDGRDEDHMAIALYMPR